MKWPEIAFFNGVLLSSFLLHIYSSWFQKVLLDRNVIIIDWRDMKELVLLWSIINGMQQFELQVIPIVIWFTIMQCKYWVCYQNKVPSQTTLILW